MNSPRYPWIWLGGILLFGLNPTPVAFAGSPPSLEEISDRKYLPRLLELIQKAERSIEVSMYQSLLSGKEETHPVYQILKALADAHGRGVRVRAVFNRYLDYFAGDTVPLARSLAAHEYLKTKGIEVLLAHPSRRLHDKVIVIDERWVIEGSMNWTQTALQSNWESATLIDSPDYAAQKLVRLRALPTSPEKTLDTLGDEGALLPIPALLMTEKKYFPDLLRRKDEKIFEFYLRLALESARTGQTKWILPDEILFERFGLEASRPLEDRRRETLRLLKKLKKRGFIKLNVPAPGKPAEITLIGLGGPWAISREPSKETSRFSLPVTYFDFGYPKRLSFAAEFSYLAARLEMGQSPSAPWWWRSQEHLTQVYHLHHTTLASGMLELVRENLIEIVRDDAPEGRPPSERLVNRYRVNHLTGPETRRIQDQRLIQKFGEERFNQTRRWADLIDEPNDPVVLAAILKWMDLYSKEDLEAAFQQVARYERNNPRRSLYYLRGILEGMRK